MIRTIQDFLNSWQFECDNTEQLLLNVTDESLTKQLVPGGRTIGRLAWHIIETPKEMLGLVKVAVAGPIACSDFPHDIKEIIAEHRRVSDSVAEQIKKNWKDETLLKTDPMYGEEWTRGQTLSALILHLIHHRGQLTVLMRLAGLKVPGIYGPAKEEWADFGMEAHP